MYKVTLPKLFPEGIYSWKWIVWSKEKPCSEMFNFFSLLTDVEYLGHHFGYKITEKNLF